MIRRPENKKIAHFLYDILVARAPAKDYAKRVAKKMGVPYPTLARYWQGRAAFPAGLVSSLFLATDQDIRVAETVLLEGSDYRLERKDADPEDLDIPRAVMHLSSVKGEINRIYLSATSEESEDGGSISFAEARDLAAALRRLTQTAEELRVVIKKKYL
jgi:hypothetical protein